MQHHIDDLNDVASPHHIRLVSENGMLFMLMLNTDGHSVDNADYTLSLHYADHHEMTLDADSRTIHVAVPVYNDGESRVVASWLYDLFASERAYVRHVLLREDDKAVPESVNRAVKSAAEYQLTFSLLNGGGTGILSWEIEQALKGKMCHIPCPILIYRLHVGFLPPD
jgi:hypothetical protein